MLLKSEKEKKRRIMRRTNEVFYFSGRTSSVHNNINPLFPVYGTEVPARRDCFKFRCFLSKCFFHCNVSRVRELHSFTVLLVHHGIPAVVQRSSNLSVRRTNFPGFRVGPTRRRELQFNNHRLSFWVFLLLLRRQQMQVLRMDKRCPRG